MTELDPVVYLDTETSGLNPERHSIFEIALIEADGTEHVWVLPIDLSTADPGALRVNRYYERAAQLLDMQDNNSDQVAFQIATLTSNKHIVGNVPAFDAAFLTSLLKKHKLVPAWHYHLVDVEALVAGKLGLRPPWKSHDLSLAIGVEPPTGPLAHTALADARWAKALYEAVFAVKT